MPAARAVSLPGCGALPAEEPVRLAPLGVISCSGFQHTGPSRLSIQTILQH